MPDDFYGDSPDVLPAIESRLLYCVQVLDSFTAITEDEFLSTGSRLRDFHSRSLRIAERSTFITDMIAGDRILGSIEGLNSLMEKMEEYLLKSETLTAESMNKLGGIVNTIEDTHLNLEELTRISKTLRVLGLSTILQSAVLKRPSEGGRALGEDVKRLSQIVQEKARDISRNTEALIVFIQEKLLRLKVLGESQREKGASVIRATLSGINSLIAEDRVSRSASHDITVAAGDISQNIGNVVTLQQFHDITRQQFEGSRNALAGMFSTLQRSAAPGGSIFDGESGRPDLLQELVRCCLQQSGSLSHTRDEFIFAVNNIISNLGNIALSVREMHKKTVQVVRPDGDSGSFIAELEHTLSSVMSTLTAFSEIIAARKELAAAVAYLDKTTGEMSGFIREIEDIGDDVEIIALNSSVNACMIGEGGEGLAVVAERTQQVSLETRKHTGVITGMLIAITGYTAELSGTLDSSFAEDDAEVVEMSSNLRTLVNILHTANREILAAFSEIESLETELAGEIEAVVAKFTVHSLVDASVNRILSVIEGVLSSLKEAVPDIIETGTVSDGYVLSAEEFGMPRMSSSDSKETEAPYDRGKELGENIELF